MKRAILAIYNPVMGRVFSMLERAGFVQKSAFFAQFNYASDGLYTLRNADFLQDPRFVKATQAAKRATNYENYRHTWRTHVSLWAASHGMKLEGDFVECGVWKGFNARAIFEYLDFTNSGRKFYLLDTYRGMDSRYISADERARGLTEAVYSSDFYEEAMANLGGFNNAVLVRGPIPDTLPQATPERVAYLHIDMNTAAPEIAAAEYFWPRMVPGAIMLLDDYGFGAHIEQKQAFDKFAAEKGVAILSLPTGQGMLIKA